ncbi:MULTISPECIES: VOC family protein [Thermomonospora]|uniref:Putative enzyme related to lactoylglutathione lyase n=1 Tax=Thermomonospora cellulosilytica TaxID=1411118 RepID=A0A7W3R9D5_9ACTN|nr:MULTISPECIES: VOC family protein [Thermomonospora]MBA9004245.1 putative enzyme related to lactoylglutathione lyase [Thermomonospora cellulosilytica]
MVEVTEHEPAAPSWVELASPDPPGAHSFYGALLGWRYYTIADGKLGDYDMFTMEDDTGPEVAGLSALADDTVPPAWTCYFNVTDILPAAKAVEAAGGRVLADPVDVAHLGRMAVCADVAGAGFGLWQPYTFPGTTRIAEPGALCWIELCCRDVEAARRFYGDVFGWKALDEEYGGLGYTVCLLGDRRIAGIIGFVGHRADDRVARWMPYFGVGDCDAATAHAAGMGARVRVPPTAIDPGRFSVLSDPTGADLGLAQLPAPAGQFSTSTP